MERNTALTILIGVLVLLAGCSSVLPDSDSTTPTEVQTNTAPTSTPQSVSLDDATYPPGSNQTSLAAALVSSTHQAALQSSDNYTTEFNVSRIVDQQRQNDYEIIRQQDNAGNRSLTELNTFQQNSTYTVVEYTDNGVTDRKQPDQVLYDTESMFGPDSQGLSYFGSVPYNFTATSAYVVDGTTHVVYETDADSNTELIDAQTGENQTVEELSGQVVISEDGVVKQYNFSVSIQSDGSTVTNGIGYELRDIGTTTFAAPEWTDNSSSTESG